MYELLKSPFLICILNKYSTLGWMKKKNDILNLTDDYINEPNFGPERVLL